MRAWARILLAAWWLAACAGLPCAGPAAAQVYHRGNDGDPETLDPHKSSTVAEAHILRDLYEGLVIHDADGRIAAGVAESWQVSPDGLTYTFRLRADARWSNGDPVTAADFVFSLRRILAPGTGAKYATILYPIRGARALHKAEPGAAPEALGVRALDPRTLELTLERPTAYFLELLAHTTALPLHQASLERHGRDWVRPGNTVSNGAYTLRDSVPNTGIRLARNPHFHARPTVQIEEVVYHPVPDNAAGVRRYRAGELHSLSDLPTDQVPALRERFGDQVVLAPALGVWCLVFNTRKAPFSDARVRQALSLALDRETLAERIWNDTMLPAYSLVPPGIAGYEPALLEEADLGPFEREDRARALLAAAGYGPEKPLRVELRYNNGGNNRAAMVAVAAQWRALGVETTFISTDAKTHFAYLRDGGDFDAARYAWIGDYADAQNFLFLLESDNRGFNAGGYASPEFDALMREAAAEPEAGRRAAVLHRAEALLMRDLPWIPVLHYKSKHLVSPRLTGFRPNLAGVAPTRFLRLEAGP